MRKLRKNEDMQTVRLISVPDAAAYMGVGFNTARKVCGESGSILHIGKRVLVDLRALDAYLDSLTNEA